MGATMQAAPSEPLVRPGFVRTMAAYNAEMNGRLYAAAARLSDAERRRDRGAFWGSLHCTFCHLLWGDRMWMSRFAGWAKLACGITESGALVAGFDELMGERFAADAAISAWAQGVSDEWLAADLVWFSAALGREVQKPRGLLVVHFFNHQTHHRGQAHALITAAGERTGDTDLFIVV